MANATVLVGGIQKIESENNIRVYGDCWVSGQSEEAGLPWTSDPVTIGSNLLAIEAAIRAAVVAAAEAAEYTVNPLLDVITIHGGPSAI